MFRVIWWSGGKMFTKEVKTMAEADSLVDSLIRGGNTSASWIELAKELDNV